MPSFRAMRPDQLPEHIRKVIKHIKDHGLLEACRAACKAPENVGPWSNDDAFVAVCQVMIEAKVPQSKQKDVDNYDEDDCALLVFALECMEGI